MATENSHDDISSGEEEVIRDETVSTPPPELEKSPEALSQEAALRELSELSDSQMSEVQNVFSEMDKLMGEYEKMKELLADLKKNDPKLSKYL